ncbi:MAG: (Fe-S)-binding protein, partial [Chloroflexaceae bacterium]|nr:(Fe-S)-binding protein [Chloroflexaceae bacterium]
LRDMAFSASEQFALARHQPGATTSGYLFFPGCQLSGSTPAHVERVYADLCARSDAPVGLWLSCCGVPADWAGRTELFQAHLAQLKQQLEALGNPTLMLPCSSCYQSFQHHLPQQRIVSLWDWYANHGLPPDAQPAAAATVSIHDPCSTRYAAHIHTSTRALVTALGHTIDELPLSRERTTCCSYGGHQWLANPEVARKVIERRISESEHAYVTYCAMCRDFFAAQGKRTLHLLDLIYGSERDGGRGPGFSQRHENRARLKRSLLQQMWGEPMADQASYESIQLIISDEVRARMEERHILDDDVRRVLNHAEQTGARFFNQATGRWLASFRPTAVTYWVEYLPQDGGYLIINTYSHRMEVVQDHAHEPG